MFFNKIIDDDFLDVKKEVPERETGPGLSSETSKSNLSGTLLQLGHTHSKKAIPPIPFKGYYYDHMGAIFTQTTTISL